MEEVGREREARFRQFPGLPNGIPDADTFRRVFEKVNPAELMKALQEWLCGMSGAGGREVNIGGKAMRGSGRGDGQKAVHIVSARVNGNNLTPGELATAEKSNGITAIPQLPDTTDISADIVTTDAMGCRTAVAAKIRQRKADYVLAVKENQPVLHEEVKGMFDFPDSKDGRRELPEDVFGTGSEKGHGRIEGRRIRTVCDIGFLSNKKAWKDIKTIVQCRSTRTIGAVTTTADRCYISSLDVDAARFVEIIRGHWSIENKLHWSLDVTFNEDGCRARKDNSPANLNILRKIALARLRAIDGGNRVGLRRKMLRAALNPDFLHKVLSGG